MTDISGSNGVSDGSISHYTPTTEEVRILYVCQRESIYGVDHDGAEFDRWLAEVKAKAWEEGWLMNVDDRYSSRDDNPYRQGETE